MATLELQNLEGKPGAYMAATARRRRHRRRRSGRSSTWSLGQRIAEHIPFLAPNRTGVGKVGFTVDRPGLLHRQELSDRDPAGLGPDHPHRPPSCSSRARPTPRRRRCCSGLAAGATALQVQVSYSPFKGFDPGADRRVAVALSLRLHRAAGLDRLSRCSTPQRLSSDPKLRQRAGGAERRGRQAARPRRAWTARSASGGSATARPIRGWAPTSPTS